MTPKCPTCGAPDAWRDNLEEAIAARDSAPSLHPLALAYLEATAKDRGEVTPTRIHSWDAWTAAGCPIWQTPPASPSTESAQAPDECQARSPGRWWCTLPAGHDGEHVATDGKNELERWGAASREPAAPCGASWASDPFQPCSLPAGHDGPHRDNWGRWGPGLEEAMREPAAPSPSEQRGAETEAFQTWEARKNANLAAAQAAPAQGGTIRAIDIEQIRAAKYTALTDVRDATVVHKTTHAQGGTIREAERLVDWLVGDAEPTEEDREAAKRVLAKLKAAGVLDGERAERKP